MDDPIARASRFCPPSEMMDVVGRLRDRLWWGLFAFVLGIALWLRTDALGVRPMHADEANQAVKLGALLERGEYAFDPRDHHGPTLYYFGLVPAWIRQERTLAQLTETTVRLTPAFFGVFVVGLVALAAAPLGRGGAWAAAVFAALAPASVYFSRYFIQETLLVAFTVGAWVAATRCWQTGRTRWGLVAGIAVGLMQATKASAPLFAVAAAIAWGVMSCGRAKALRASAVDSGAAEGNGGVPAPRPWKAPLMWGSFGFAIVFVVFYSSFFTHAAGLRDAFLTYGPMSGRVAMQTSGHEKPWWYYGSLFWWQRQGGYIWDQSLFLGLAVAGGALAVVVRDRFARGVAVYFVLIAAALALTPYKTPWVAVNLVPPMAILAASALSTAARWGNGVRVPVALTFATAVALLSWQVRRAVFQRPADARNPFAYVHSGPDVRKLPALVERAGPGPIKIVSEEYWPLPWYLRNVGDVGYWTAVPDDCDGALVLCSANLAEAVKARLKFEYRESYLGLRPGFVLVVFTRTR